MPAGPENSKAGGKVSCATARDSNDRMRRCPRTERSTGTVYRIGAATSPTEDPPPKTAFLLCRRGRRWRRGGWLVGGSDHDRRRGSDHDRRRLHGTNGAGQYRPFVTGDQRMPIRPMQWTVLTRFRAGSEILRVFERSLYDLALVVGVGRITAPVDGEQAAQPADAGRGDIPWCAEAFRPVLLRGSLHETAPQRDGELGGIAAGNNRLRLVEPHPDP